MSGGNKFYKEKQSRGISNKVKFDILLRSLWKEGRALCVCLVEEHSRQVEQHMQRIWSMGMLGVVEDKQASQVATI